MATRNKDKRYIDKEVAGLPVVPQPVAQVQGYQDDLPDWLRDDPARDAAITERNRQDQLARQAQQAQAPISTPAPGSAGGGGGQNYGQSPANLDAQYQAYMAALPPVPNSGAYDPGTNQAYVSAMQALQQAQGSKPTYYDSYGEQLNALFNKIMNRDQFSYDLGSDTLYQQYRDQAIANGRLAMQDTMGRAAALTGGYGSTYGQQVGQQAYDAYLQTLNEQIPALYQQALNAYNAEGDRMMQQYGLVADLRNDEYGKYRDSLSDYWQNVNYQTGRADNAWNQGYQQWQAAYNADWDRYNAAMGQAQFQYNAQQDALDRQLQYDQIAYNREQDALDRQMQQEQLAYNRQNDSYERLMQLITNTGYQPTQAELEAAGMSAQEAQSWGDYYQIQQDLAAQKAAGTYSSSGRSSGGGGGSRSSGSGSGSGSEDAATVSLLDQMKALGRTEAGRLAAQSLAASSSPNERTYNAIMAEYDYWFNNGGDEGSTEDPNAVDWSQIRNNVVDNATMELAQIADVAARYNRLEQMLKQGIINEEEEWLLYRNLMNGYEPPKSTFSSGKYGNGGR